MKIFSSTEVNISSMLVSLPQGTSISLQVLAIPLDILHHVVLASELIVCRKMADYPDALKQMKNTYSSSSNQP